MAISATLATSKTKPRRLREITVQTLLWHRRAADAEEPMRPAREAYLLVRYVVSKLTSLS